MSKPRISRVFMGWKCEGDGWGFHAATPTEAYDGWKRAVQEAKQ